MTRTDNFARGINRGNVTEWISEILSQSQHIGRQGVVQRHLSPAGMPIDVSFDDEELAASYHGRILDTRLSDDDVRCRIDVLTVEGLDIQSEWEDPGFAPTDFHETLAADGLRAAYPFQKGLWRILDLKSRVGLQWCSTTDKLPPWDASAPLRQHLHWLLQDRRLRLAHAATLGSKNGGIVLFGRGGAGKSGTTLAGLAAGLSTVGDDYIALGNAPAPFARPLYRTVKQDQGGLSRLSGLAGRMAGERENWRGKVEFDPSLYFDDAFLEHMPIRAVILPRIAHLEKPLLSAARPQQAMLSLMTSNLHQFAGEEENGMQFFAEFLKVLPCFQLDLSTDAVRNGDFLRDFVERLET